MPSIIISDTNILLKLIFFTGLDLNNLVCKKFGKVTWHPHVAKELRDWVGKHNRKGNHPKVKKFGLDVIQKAITIAKSNECQRAPYDVRKKDLALKQYASIAAGIHANSAEPHPNDLDIIYDVIESNSALMTNDIIIQKIAAELIGDSSFQLRFFLNELVIEGSVTEAQVSEFAQTLSYYGETF